MKVIQVKPEPYCPVCGAKMKLREPKPHQDWPPFWGCSQYPDCEGTRNIREDGKPDNEGDYGIPGH
jgi:ssDNA-binding Zn-finger/Zn-ribbon topoisomerase 1